LRQLELDGKGTRQNGAQSHDSDARSVSPCDPIMSDLAEIPRAPASAPPSRSAADRLMLVSVGALAVIAVLTGAYFASTVLAPIACAFFIIALSWPMQKWLQAHLPRLLALAIVISIIAIVFVVFGSLIAWGLGRVARWLAT